MKSNAAVRSAAFSTRIPCKPTTQKHFPQQGISLQIGVLLLFEVDFRDGDSRSERKRHAPSSQGPPPFTLEAQQRFAQGAALAQFRSLEWALLTLSLGLVQDGSGVIHPNCAVGSGRCQGTGYQR